MSPSWKTLGTQFTKLAKLTILNYRFNSAWPVQLSPLEEHVVVGKKIQTIFSKISMGNVVYHHQEHVCNEFLMGRGNLKMAVLGVTDFLPFWCPGGPKIRLGTTKMMNFEHQRVWKEQILRSTINSFLYISILSGIFFNNRVQALGLLELSMSI